jgi:CBS domain-containing protein
VRRGTLVPDAYVVDPMRLFRVRDLMNPEFDTIRSDRKVPEILAALMNFDFLPVVDEKDQVVGVLHRVDLISAAETATAGELARRDLPVVHPDEVIHDVIQRFLEGKFRACPVVDRKDGTFLGMLTALDVLKAKDWEYRQETREPQIWSPSLLRFGAQTTNRPANADRP